VTLDLPARSQFVVAAQFGVLRSLILFCRRFARRVLAAGAAEYRVVFQNAQTRVACRDSSDRVRSTSQPSVRAKIMLGFAVTLALSAATMGFAYVGFERVPPGSGPTARASRKPIWPQHRPRADLLRSLARYFVATGKEDDAKAALAAEASLKEAILASMEGTTNPARLAQITKLEREFRAFTKIFAEIVRLKDDSTRRPRRTSSSASATSMPLQARRSAGERARCDDLSPLTTKV